MNYAALITVIAIACSFYLGYIGNEAQAAAFALIANVWAAAHWIDRQYNS